MSRVAAFALGSATSGVGYLRLRERTWERPCALSSGLREAQAEIPGSTPLPLVRAVGRRRAGGQRRVPARM